MRQSNRNIAVFLGMLTLAPAISCSTDGSGEGTPGSPLPDVATDAESPAFGDASAGEPDVSEEPLDSVVLQPDGGGLSPDAPCPAGRLDVVRTEPWAGGGTVVFARLRDEQGVPVVGVDLDTIALGAVDDPFGPVGVATPALAGLVSIALVPSPSEAEHAARLGAARAIVESLPAADRVAVYVFSGNGFELRADLTERRAHTLATLDEVAPAAENPASEPALGALGDALDGVQPLDGPALRLVVSIAGHIAISGRSGSWELDDAADAAAAIAAERTSLMRIAACPPVKGDLLLHMGGFACSVKRPATLAGEALVPCDVGEAARAEFPYGDTIALMLDAEQQAVWNQRYEAESKEEFELSIRIGAGAPLEARANFRGQTSLGCARKSLAINVKGKDPVRVARGIAADHFLLVSLCKDDGLFQQVFADRLLRAMGIFPIDLRFVRLLNNGDNLGVYIALDDPEAAVVVDHLAADTLLRRRTEPDDIPMDVELPKDDAEAAQALAKYEELRSYVAAVDGDALAAALASRMEIDLYLRWLAFNSFFGNGDYVDEAFFYGRAVGTDHWYFRHFGWDPDDLFSECHHEGKFAIHDPHGLLFCAEATLDEALLASPGLYSRFVDHLEALLESDLTQGVLEEAMAMTQEELFALLDDDTAAAVVELKGQVDGDVNADSVQALIYSKMLDFLDEAEKRRGALRQLVAAYRGASDAR